MYTNELKQKILDRLKKSPDNKIKGKGNLFHATCLQLHQENKVGNVWAYRQMEMADYPIEVTVYGGFKDEKTLDTL